MRLDEFVRCTNKIREITLAENPRVRVEVRREDGRVITSTPLGLELRQRGDSGWVVVMVTE